jgi:chemotaxis protein MotB
MSQIIMKMLPHARLAFLDKPRIKIEVSKLQRPCLTSIHWENELVSVYEPFKPTGATMLSKIILAAILTVSLSACVSQSTYNKEVGRVDALAAQNKTYQALNTQLQTEVQADVVRIKQLQGRLTVTLIDEVAFSSGSAEMHAKGRGTLEKIIGTLQGVTDKRIVVRGFTDNEPVGHALRARYPSNWELSTARACDVVRFLEAKGIDGNRLEAAGYAEFQAVAPNTTAAGRKQNRRIEIILTDMSF